MLENSTHLENNENIYHNKPEQNSLFPYNVMDAYRYMTLSLTGTACDGGDIAPSPRDFRVHIVHNFVRLLVTEKRIYCACNDME